MISDPPQPPPVHPSAPVEPAYSPCEQCGAPLDERQRYCLSCGTRRRHANDPAARFLATATRRQQARPAQARSAGSVSAWALAAVLAVPLALGAGVLIGRGSQPGNAGLAAALRAAQAPRAGGSAGSTGPLAGGSAGGARATGLTLGSWSRSSGYTVQLGTLSSGTSKAAAARVEQSDRSKGASQVGILAASGYHISPAPGGAYVIYSGVYGSASQANHALAKLHRSFPGARVIHVTRVKASSGGSASAASQTQSAAVPQATGFKPTAGDIKQGAQAAQKDAHATGKNASGAGLPSVVVVP